MGRFTVFDQALPKKAPYLRQGCLGFGKREKAFPGKQENLINSSNKSLP